MALAVPVIPADDLAVAKDFYINRLRFRVLFEASHNGKTEEWRGRVEIRQPPRDEPLGARTFDVIDPFGNTLFVLAEREGDDHV